MRVLLAVMLHVLTVNQDLFFQEAHVQSKVAQTVSSSTKLPTHANVLWVPSMKEQLVRSVLTQTALTAPSQSAKHATTSTIQWEVPANPVLLTAKFATAVHHVHNASRDILWI